MLSFFRRNSSLEHFFGLPGDIIKHFADGSDAFLATNLPVSRNKERVLIERRKFLQGVAPAGNGCLLVKAHRIPAAEEQITGIHHILVRDAPHHVCSGMPWVGFDHCR